MFPSSSPAAPPAPPVAAEQVYAELAACLGVDAAARSAASERLQRWERAAAPGYWAGLVNIAGRAGEVPEDVRLLAVVTLKNAVGATWRKTLASREWARVPEEERAYVRSAAQQLLLRDPSERVALHAALLIANVARFDAPRRWPALLPSLAAAARWEEAGTGLSAKARALKALKHVAAALSGARASAGGAGAAAEDARATRAAAAALFPLLASEWRAHAAAAAAGDAQRAALALRCLPVLRALFRMLPALNAPELQTTPLMEAFLAQLSAGADAGAAPPAPSGTGGAKHFRLVAECVAAAMDAHPAQFVPFLAPFVAVFARGVLQLPPTALADDPKRAQVLTRFLANALLAPEYKPRRPQPPPAPDGTAPPSPPDSPPPLISADDLDVAFGRLPRESAEAAAEAAAVAAAAESAFAPLFEGDAMVRALVERYLVPTAAELEEWRADPEALLAAGEPAAAGAEADSARPCAETLLLCLLLRDRQRVAATALRLAAQAQATPVDSADATAVLFRDGVYRALGVLAPELPAGAVDFGAWLRSELAPLLATHAAAVDGARRGDPAAAAAAASLPRRLLAARALWLIGRFSEAVVEAPAASASQQPAQADASAAPPVCGPLTHAAVSAILPHLAPEDPLLALHAAAALRALCSGVASAASSRLWRGAFAEGASPAAAAAAAVAPWGVVALSRSLALLPALPEPESMASVLRLCGLLVDLLGRRHLAPHAAALANSLPAVWTAVDARARGEPGAGARAHAALLGALAHLLSVLGTAALAGDAGGTGAVIFPLLAHATDPNGTQRDALLDDGVALWLAALRASTALYEPLAALTPRLFELLSRDPSHGLVLALQGYILIGGAEWLDAHAAAVVAALAPPLLSCEPGGERALLAAAAGLDIAVQMRPGAVFPHLAPVLATLTRRLALMHGGGRRAEADEAAAALIPTAAAAKAYVGLLARASLHAPSALWELCADDGALTASVAAVWAELSSLRHMEELLSVGATSRALAVGGGPAPSAHAEERHLAALGLCAALAAAAAVPNAGASALCSSPGAPPPPSGAAAVLRCAAPALALALQCLSDLRQLTGDGAAAGPLPLPAWRGGAAAASAADEEDGALPNQVDVAAYRLAAGDPVHTAPLRAAAVAALRGARGALGDAQLQAALSAEERLEQLPPQRLELWQSLLAEA